MPAQFHPAISYSAYNHTLAHYPVRLFERHWFRLLATFGLGLGLWVIQVSFNLFPVAIFIAIGLLCHICGFAWDTYTTTKTINLKPLFTKRRLEFPIYEANPFLPVHPTFSDQLKSPSNLILLAALPLIYAVPSLGIASGAVQFLAGMFNLRQYKRLTLTIIILDNAIKRNLAVE